jgi:transposase
VEAKHIGLDISKNLFEVHGVNKKGQVVLQRSLHRWQLRETFSQMPRCVIGLEACGTAHQWGQQLASFGHDVRLLSPHVVAPYRGYVESGATTAQLICEALGRSGASFTRVKGAKRRGRFGQIPMPQRLLESLRLAVGR